MSEQNPYKDEDTLRQLYHGKKMSSYEVADELGCSARSVRRWMEKFGIERRDQVGYGPWMDKGLMQDLYSNKKLSAREIGERLGCGQQTILRWLNRHNIKTRSHTEGAKIANLKKPTSHCISKGGYELVATKIGGSKKEVRVHRLVAVAEHGVEAVKDKVVHHRNGIPWDNRPENLEIMTVSEHISHHNPVMARWRDSHFNFENIDADDELS